MSTGQPAKGTAKGSLLRELGSILVAEILLNCFLADLKMYI